jgi:hypothetical protein
MVKPPADDRRSATKPPCQEWLDLAPLRAFYRWQMSRNLSIPHDRAGPRVTTKALRVIDIFRQYGASAGFDLLAAQYGVIGWASPMQFCAPSASTGIIHRSNAPDRAR